MGKYICIKQPRKTPASLHQYVVSGKYTVLKSYKIYRVEYKGEKEYSWSKFWIETNNGIYSPRHSAESIMKYFLNLDRIDQIKSKTERAENYGRQRPD